MPWASRQIHQTDAPIGAMRSADFTVSGTIAHESAMSDGNWRDVPVFDW